MFWKALETRSTDFPREVSLKTSSSFNHRTKSRNRTEHQYTFLYHNSLWTIIRLHTYHCTINSYSYQISWIANSRKCKTDFCKRDHQLSRDKFDEPVKFWHFFSFFVFSCPIGPCQTQQRSISSWTESLPNSAVFVFVSYLIEETKMNSSRETGKLWKIINLDVTSR